MEISFLLNLKFLFKFELGVNAKYLYLIDNIITMKFYYMKTFYRCGSLPRYICSFVIETFIK